MSVRTEADEHRDAAVEHINEAAQHLSKIVIERVWGWDEYKKEYLVKLEKALHDLLNMRNGL